MNKKFLFIYLYIFINKYFHGYYLILRSGEAQRTATLGICGTKRIAIAT